MLKNVVSKSIKYFFGLFQRGFLVLSKVEQQEDPDQRMSSILPEEKPHLSWDTARLCQNKFQDHPGIKDICLGL